MDLDTPDAAVELTHSATPKKYEFIAPSFGYHNPD